MANGKISIRKLNLRGYTPETQIFFIENGGGANVAEFLNSNADHFVHIQHMGQPWYALPASRIENFRGYAASLGFEVTAGLSV